MKSFKEYLAESKKVYEFKVRIAGDCPKDCASKVRAALAEFHVSTVSAGKSTPIQETHSEFPDHRNVSLTVFDVSTSYPATSPAVTDKIAEALGIAHSCVKVRTFKEEEEFRINNANVDKSGKALLGTDYEASNHQGTVGDEHSMSLLKELGKQKHSGTQYKGVNDELFASKPVKPEKSAPTKSNVKVGSVSPVGTKKAKLTPVAAATHNGIKGK